MQSDSENDQKEIVDEVYFRSEQGRQVRKEGVYLCK